MPPPHYFPLPALSILLNSFLAYLPLQNKTSPFLVSSIMSDFVGPCDGLMPTDGKNYRYKLVLVEYNIPGHPSGVGGADKGKNGHRVDSIPIANGVIKTGNLCFPIKYLPERHEEFAAIVKGVDGIIVRINPGQMNNAQQAKYDTLMVSSPITSDRTPPYTTIGIVF